MPLALSPTPAEYNRVAILAMAFVGFMLGMGFLLAWSTTGTFCYALDDSFIMMAISKNLAEYGVWGLTQYEFSSTASSPLFTVLLAVFIKIFGNHLILPLLINLVTLVVVIFWLKNRAIEWGLSLWQTWFLLIGFIILAPVPILIYGSMEHLLHILISLACLYYVIEKDESVSLSLLFLLGICLGGIRYEGLFEGGILVLYFWKRGYWKKGFIFGLALVLPMLILGFYSVSKGWFFLPNSLVLKALYENMVKTQGIMGFIHSLLVKGGRFPHGIAIILVLVLAFNEKTFPKGKEHTWITIILLTNIAHFFLARYGHVFRYEAYLITMAWVAFWRSLCVSQQIPSMKSISIYLNNNKEMWLMVLALAATPMYRSIQSYGMGTTAMVNIYEQQVQTGKFVQQHYNGVPVGAIDIGALAYYSDSPILDLWGLASMEAAKLKFNKQYSYSALDSLCRAKGVKFVIYYGEKPNGTPWQIVASWTIRNNRVCADEKIEFLALDQNEAVVLGERLRKFQKQLPSRVIVQYYPETD